MRSLDQRTNEMTPSVRPLTSKEKDADISEVWDINAESGAMVRLNPYALAHRRTELRAQAARKAAKAAKVKAARNKKAERTAFYNGLVAE